LNYEFSLACELKMTVSRLRTELTEDEFIYFAAYHELKAEKEKEQMERASRRR
jgi:hypothetical protein